MNQTEALFYRSFIAPLLLTGECLQWGFDAITLVIGDNCRYTPDFFTIAGDGEIVFHEVKGGYVRDDARVKFKAAQAQYPHFKFTWNVCKNTRKGDWTHESS